MFRDDHVTTRAILNLKSYLAFETMQMYNCDCMRLTHMHVRQMKFFQKLAVNILDSKATLSSSFRLCVYFGGRTAITVVDFRLSVFLSIFLQLWYKQIYYS